MNYSNYPQNFAADRVVDVTPQEQVTFYRRTYTLVAASCVAFGAVLCLFLATPIAGMLANLIFGTGWLGYLVFIAAFWAISWYSQKLAFGGATKGAQMLGLGLTILIYSAIVSPVMLFVIAMFGAESAMNDVFVPAGISTLALAAGLTATVFMTKKDFSFLRTIIVVGSFIALGWILCSLIFGATLGSGFIFAMIALIAITILYETWVVRTQLTTDQYVGAALLIFSSIATLFYYLILLFAKNRE